MSWTKIKSELLPDIQERLNKLRAINEIRNSFNVDGIVNNKKIDLLYRNATRIFEKLNSGEFQIAVVGLEGSGKSTFVNALIEYDFLPTDEERRCTYASVELRPSKQEQGQRAIVTMKTVKEFEDYITDMKEMIERPNAEVTKRGTSSLLKELEKIQDSQTEINKHLVSGAGDSQKSFPFSTLSELKDQISDYITSPSKARAVKNIQIYTDSMGLNSKDKEFVLYDVPGYDSPLRFHKEQTEKRLAEADLIIFVQSLAKDRSDLKNEEVVMLDISDEFDQTAKLKDKLFVFLNKGDRLESKQIFESKKQVSFDDWVKNYKYCYENRVVAGSALGYLINKGQHATNFENKINPQKVLERQDAFGLTSGIDDLLQKMNDYLETDRYTVLKNACKNIIEQIDQISRDLKKFLEEKYNFNVLEDFDTQKETAISIEFKKWFDNWWKNAETKFDNWYFDEVLTQRNSNEGIEKIDKLQGFQQQHAVSVQKFTWSIPDEDFKNAINKTAVGKAPQILDANYYLRNVIYHKNMKNVEGIATDLSVQLINTIEEIIDWLINNVFFEIDGMEQFLYNCIYEGELPEGPHSTQSQLFKTAISALYIRYARPVVEVLTKAPQGTNDRISMINKHKVEIESLRLFSKGSNKSGWHHLEALLEVISPNENNIHDVTNQTLKPPSFTEGVFTKPKNYYKEKQSSSEDELRKEIEHDASLFSEILNDTLIDASGIIIYCEQEIEKVRREFKNKENQDKYYGKLLLAFKQGQIKDPELNQLGKKFESSVEDLRRAKALHSKL